MNFANLELFAKLFHYSGIHTYHSSCKQADKLPHTPTHTRTFTHKQHTEVSVHNLELLIIPQMTNLPIKTCFALATTALIQYVRCVIELPQVTTVTDTSNFACFACFSYCPLVHLREQSSIGQLSVQKSELRSY